MKKPTELTDEQKNDDEHLFKPENHDKLISKIATNTLVARSKEWIENTLNNMPMFLGGTDFSALRNIAGGRPVVVCAAGPSLHKQLPRLKRIQEHVIIVCVNTSYGPLIKAGIEPDFIASIESKDVGAMFKGLALKGCLVRCAETSPALEQQDFENQIVYCNSTGVYANWMRFVMNERLAVDAGGSVACSAFSMSVALGAGKIILIGQDLAYTGGGAYTKGSRYQHDSAVFFDVQQGRILVSGKKNIADGLDGAQTHNVSRMGTVQSWYGKRKKCQYCKGTGKLIQGKKCHLKHKNNVKQPCILCLNTGKVAYGPDCNHCNKDGYHREFTNETFAFFLNWFISAGGVMKEKYPHIPIINATEGGAWIEGFEHLTFKNATRGVRKYLRKGSVQARIRDANSRIGQAPRYIEYLSNTLLDCTELPMEEIIKNPLFRVYSYAVHKIPTDAEGVDLKQLDDKQMVELLEYMEEFKTLVGSVLRKLVKILPSSQ